MAHSLDYRPPNQDQLGDMSVEHEPHLAPLPPPLNVQKEVPTGSIETDRGAAAFNSVWEEPALSPELASGPPPTELTYARWLDEQTARTSAHLRWLVAGLLALIAGPWAVIGAFWGSGQSVFSALVLVTIAPTVEELMKASAALYVAEKRPYLFGHPAQIVLCGVCAGLSFAAIENLIYLYIYIPHATPQLWVWRWTVCVALHTTCSGIASVGVWRVWRDAVLRRSLPRTSLASPWLTAAIILHGLYNAFALIMPDEFLMPASH
jgi:hypothetical protein